MKLKFKKSKNGKAFFLTLWRNGVHDYINPVRDWTIGLAVAILVFLCGVAYISFDFYTQFGAPKDTVYVESQSVGYRDVEVKKYAEQYIEKERVFNELRKDRSYVIEVIPESPVSTSTEMGTLSEESAELADIELAE